MNKTELVAAVAEAAGLSKKDAEKAVKAFVDTVAAELKKGEKVQIVGFGSGEPCCLHRNVTNCALVHVLNGENSGGSVLVPVVMPLLYAQYTGS